MSRHLLVIGAQRCGTTYLARLLDAHPQITMARPARPEPKVFLSDEQTDRGLDWYRRTWFGHATDELLLGDKSTSYLEDARAALRAWRMLGAAEVVVSLRDPVDRAVSNWRFSTDNGLETRPLETALRENLEQAAAWDPAGTSVSPFAYLERGRYTDYLRPWVERYPETRVVLLPELRNDPAVLRGLYGDLGVESSFLPEGRDRRLNESQVEVPQVAEETVARMRDYYADTDAELRRLLGRPLPWRQD